MPQPWDELESIWDGWTGQCFGLMRQKGETGDLRCALGWLADLHGIKYANNVKLPHAVGLRFHAVSGWMETHKRCSVAMANDVLHWSPDQFRDLDRRLEWERIQAQLGKQIDAIPQAVLFE